MMKYKVKIEKTANKFINKFEINSFITNHKNYEYSNIDEAKNSKLAQELFYLPFVKKVYITPSFISIERFNIIEWNDVEEEVRVKIENYLNSGLNAVDEPKKNIKNPISIYSESTPNPSVMKFVSNKILIDTNVEFNNIDEASEMKFARELFKFPFVKSIYIDRNYVSVTKYEISEWDEITPQLRSFIIDFLSKNILEYKKSKPQKYSKSDEISKQIISILDEYIKPAVSSDGGNIVFDSYDPKEKVVKVILQGACSGCPSSTITLKNGIENILKEMLSTKVDKVEAING
jgi:Fe-S cluster biogenesis protein NfuA